MSNDEQDRIDDAALELVTWVEMHHPGFGQLLRSLDRDHIRYFDLDDERIVAMIVNDVAVPDDDAPVLEIVAGTFFEVVGQDLVILEPTPETATYTARRIKPNGAFRDWTYRDEDLAKAAHAPLN